MLRFLHLTTAVLWLVLHYSLRFLLSILTSLYSSVPFAQLLKLCLNPGNTATDFFLMISQWKLSSVSYCRVLQGNIKDGIVCSNNEDKLKAFYSLQCCMKKKKEMVQQKQTCGGSLKQLLCFSGVLCRRFFRWRPRWEESFWMSQRLWTLKTAHTIWDCQSTTCRTHTGRANSSQSIRWGGYNRTYGRYLLYYKKLYINDI